MAYQVEKDTGDIVIDGFEQGIQSSPHKGIANIQNANLSTEIGEVINSFVRTQNSMTDTATTGSLTFADSSHVNLSITGSNNLFKGNWITVTNSSNTGQLPNGTYYVPASSGSTFQLNNYYAVSATVGTASIDTLLVGGGGGGGGGFANGEGGSGGGGGGGGQLLITTGSAISNGLGYVVTIGVGGGSATVGDATTFIDQKGSLSLSASGGGAGAGSNTAGGGGASGGGGAGAGAGGTGSNGKNGGSAGGGGGTNGGGGGGGLSVAGSNGSSGGTNSAANGGNGGNGTASSFTGSSVTYGSGGGGGAVDGGSAGTGGTNAGNGATNSTNGNAGTANTGSGGGGGGSFANSNTTGGVGGSGIVVIRALLGTITSATGGTHSSDSTYDYWTFTASGEWVPTIANIPAPTNTLTGFTTGLTATIQLANTMAKPIAKATETYFSSGIAYNRYYILDNNNQVWVYDTQNETTYSTSDNVGWFLPDRQTNWATNASGIGVLSGILIVTAQSGTYGKPVSNLGATNTQNTNWTEFYDDAAWESPSTSAHFAYVGHQGNMYITDGNYIRNIFPDSTLATNNSAYTITGDNVQSLASWTSSNDTQGLPTYIVPSVISGDLPNTSDNAALPVVFYTQGALPQAINANQIYYLKKTSGAATNNFQVFSDPSMDPINNSFTMTSMPSAGATSATLTSNWTHPSGFYETDFTYSGGTEIHVVYYTNGATTMTWATGLSNNTSSTTILVGGALNLSIGAVGTQYYATFYPLSSAGDYAGTNALYSLNQQRLTLPNFEVAQCMTEIGNLILIGCASNTLYPWDQVSNLPGNIISLPENNVQTILTVHQMAYVFAGNKGNIYISDGSVASLVTTVPDYCAGVPGTPSTYIEPYFTWGDAMYLRGRVYFSILDQTSTKAGNCGGIWSFVPTQNFYIGQDVGIAMRLDGQNSYGTYNGYASVLIGRVNQQTVGANYFSGWVSDINTPVYGIDTRGATVSTAGTVIETDLLPIGTFLKKRTFKQVEYKLSSPLDSNATVGISYRTNATDVWTSLTNLNTESSSLSGYYPVTFEKSQWVQFQVTTTPVASGNFIRFVELRLR